MLEVREDQRTVRIKRPVQTLHAESQAKALLCNQKTLDGGQSRQSAANV
jgi:hypothetical protein